jgi:hypothetical protein
MALARKHPRQEFPERRRDCDQSGDEKRQLEKIAFVHMQEREGFARGALIKPLAKSIKKSLTLRSTALARHG